MLADTTSRGSPTADKSLQAPSLATKKTHPSAVANSPSRHGPGQPVASGKSRRSRRSLAAQRNIEPLVGLSDSLDLPALAPCVAPSESVIAADQHSHPSDLPGDASALRLLATTDTKDHAPVTWSTTPVPTRRQRASRRTRTASTEPDATPQDPLAAVLSPEAMVFVQACHEQLPAATEVASESKAADEPASPDYLDSPHDFARHHAKPKRRTRGRRKRAGKDQQESKSSDTLPASEDVQPMEVEPISDPSDQIDIHADVDSHQQDHQNHQVVPIATTTSSIAPLMEHVQAILQSDEAQQRRAAKDENGIGLHSGPLFDRQGVLTIAALGKLHTGMMRVMQLDAFGSFLEELTVPRFAQWFKHIEAALDDDHIVKLYDTYDDDTLVAAATACQSMPDKKAFAALERDLGRRIGLMRRSLAASQLCLMIMRSAAETLNVELPRDLFHESALQSVTALVRGALALVQEVVVLQARDSEALSVPHATLRTLWSRTSVRHHIVLICADVADTLSRYEALLCAEHVSDDLVTSLVYSALSCFFPDVTELPLQIHAQLQLPWDALYREAMRLLRTLVHRFPSYRTTIIQEVMSNLHRFPTDHKHVLMYRSQSGQTISVLAALIMYILEGMLPGPKAWTSGSKLPTNAKPTEASDDEKEAPRKTKRRVRGLKSKKAGPAPPKDALDVEQEPSNQMTDTMMIFQGALEQMLQISTVLLQYAFDRCQSAMSHSYLQDGEMSAAADAGEAGSTATTAAVPPASAGATKTKANRTLVDSQTAFKNFLEVLIHDATSILYQPEWPAADILMLAAVRFLTHLTSSQTPTGAKTAIPVTPAVRAMAVVFLGEIGQRLRVPYHLKTGEKDHTGDGQDIVSYFRRRTVRKLTKDGVPVTDSSITVDTTKNEQLTSQSSLTAGASPKVEYGLLDRLALQVQLLDRVHATMQDHDITGWIVKWTLSSVSGDLQDAPHRDMAATILKEVGIELLLAKDAHNYTRGMSVAHRKQMAEVPPPLLSDMEMRSNMDACLELVSSHDPLALSFPSIVQAVVHAFTGDAIALRVKALKALSDILSIQPELLQDEQLQSIVRSKLQDTSTTVREAAVDLTARLTLAQWRDLRQPFNMGMLAVYYPLMATRFMDQGVSVRKRTIRYAKDVFEILGQRFDEAKRVTDSRTVSFTLASQHSEAGNVFIKSDSGSSTISNHDPLALMGTIQMDITSRLLDRIMSDSEASIRDLASRCLLDLWFPPLEITQTGGRDTHEAGDGMPGDEADPITDPDPSSIWNFGAESRTTLSRSSSAQWFNTAWADLPKLLQIQVRHRSQLILGCLTKYATQKGGAMTLSDVRSDQANGTSHVAMTAEEVREKAPRTLSEVFLMLRNISKASLRIPTQAFAALSEWVAVCVMELIMKQVEQDQGSLTSANLAMPLLLFHALGNAFPNVLSQHLRELCFLLRSVLHDASAPKREDPLGLSSMAPFLALQTLELVRAYVDGPKDNTNTAAVLGFETRLFETLCALLSQGSFAQLNAAIPSIVHLAFPRHRQPVKSACVNRILAIMKTCLGFMAKAWHGDLKGQLVTHDANERANLIRVMILASAFLRYLPQNFLRWDEAGVLESVVDTTPFGKDRAAVVWDDNEVANALLNDNALLRMIFLQTCQTCMEPLDTASCDATATPSVHVRVMAIQALGHLVTRWPRLLITDRCQAMLRSIFKNNDSPPVLLLGLMQIIVDLLCTHFVSTADTASSSDARPSSAIPADHEGDSEDDANRFFKQILTGHAEDMGDAGIASAVCQLYLPNVLQCALSPLPALRDQSLKAIELVCHAGLVHPLQCFSTIVALQSSSDPGVCARAADLQRHLASKFQSFIYSKHGETIRTMFAYQDAMASYVSSRSGVARPACGGATSDWVICRGFNLLPVPEGESSSDTMSVQPHLAPFYRTLAATGRRAQQLAFIKQLIQEVTHGADLHGLPDGSCTRTSGKPHTLIQKQQIARLYWTAENIALLPYTLVDEVRSVLAGLDVPIALLADDLRTRLTAIEEQAMATTSNPSPHLEACSPNERSEATAAPPRVAEGAVCSADPYASYTLIAYRLALLVDLKHFLHETYQILEDTPLSDHEGLDTSRSNSEEEIEVSSAEKSSLPPISERRASLSDPDSNESKSESDSAKRMTVAGSRRGRVTTSKRNTKRPVTTSSRPGRRRRGVSLTGDDIPLARRLDLARLSRAQLAALPLAGLLSLRPDADADSSSLTPQVMCQYFMTALTRLQGLHYELSQRIARNQLASDGAGTAAGGRGITASVLAPGSALPGSPAVARKRKMVIRATSGPAAKRRRGVGSKGTTTTRSAAAKKPGRRGARRGRRADDEDSLSDDNDDDDDDDDENGFDEDANASDDSDSSPPSSGPSSGSVRRTRGRRRAKPPRRVDEDDDDDDGKDDAMVEQDDALDHKTLEPSSASSDLSDSSTSDASDESDFHDASAARSATRPRSRTRARPRTRAKTRPSTLSRRKSRAA
ncbi:hypothetical protein CXG81DRAFT_17389 [Caulochytrium protostelioides]|uniref:Sister chromatid cohesion protein n=1 Tax=Caulochytrium protostelioides TaxID=1555241 RepID=A0A4P9XC88_9FUNG|nr:hypothetical protein CXG81DRAFT_17389 [Caulochytrium protostelioides]|eukprot:RKP03035.1 hypothetical protein CXG81DRAFT_17389 [Caulochytrium protostelioides]